MIDLPFYTCLHFRQSDGMPFYVGKGKASKRRAHYKAGRSERWTAQRGKKQSESTRQKRSSAMKVAWSKPEVKLAMCAARKKDQ